MNAGKTAILLQTAYNYEERGQKVLLMKPSVDTKGGHDVVSRIGLKRKVDFLIHENDSLLKKVEHYLSKIHCILVDEAQFLTRKQVNELFYITKNFDIPVIAFGLRTDFKTNGFEGAIRLLELSDSLEEMPTICRCGRKARFSGRMIHGCFQTEGKQFEIDDGQTVEYEALCGKCYMEKMKENSESLENDFL